MPFVGAAAQPLKQRFEIAGNRANLGHRGARIKSEPDTGHVAETASQIAESGASHPIGRRGLTNC